MKNFGIEKPCSEDWNKMSHNEKGAFCQLCTKQVHDFSNKSSNEIKLTLLQLSGQSVCARMTVSQENELNAEFKIWLVQRKRNPQQLFIAALLIVFGLTLFSCEDERDQRQIESVQQIARSIASNELTKLESAPGQDEVTLVTPIPEEIVVEESYIMGALPVEFVQEPTLIEEVEEVVIIAPERHIMGGASSITFIQREFFEQTSVELDENGVPYPTAFKALVFPNPAVESTTLEIQAPHKERMEINLYDMSGKLIREIHSGKISRGTYRQLIDLNDLTPGLYLIIIQSKDFKETVRVVKN
ncbi:T9SS type A sorting domain-containing protein [Fluviicola taffensis]|uniref:T9SS type A sorting domain-containing protein n=1 Tax=Fluviicola taffensis TaxID=191579 RepID=UPI003137CE37